MQTWCQEQCPDKPIIIGETGWPSAGSDNGAAHPGLAEQQQFIEDFAAWATANDVQYLYFEAFDELWKCISRPEVECHWGLFTEERWPKPAIGPALTTTTTTVTYTYKSGGDYTVRVRAENTCGQATYSATVSVCQPITNVALTDLDVTGPPTTTVGIAAIFTATASPPDAAQPITYTWQATGQTSVTHTVYSISDTVEFTWAVIGSKTITVTAANEYGVVSGTHTITIEAAPPPCHELSDVELTGPPTTTVDTATTFTATVTPPTATLPVTYTWQAMGLAEVVHTGGGISHTAVFTWGVTGPQVVTVTAVNECGGVVSGTHVITITNLPPVADAGPDQGVQVGDLVTLDGSGSTDPDGHLPLIYGWAQTGGPSAALSDATAVLPTFTAPGTPTVLTFTLTVTDAHDLADPTPDEVVITVTDRPITGLSTENSSPTTLGQPTFFTATITSGSNVTYAWAFGDGDTDTGETVSHTYVAAGTYTAIVTASNSISQVIATTPVTITNQPPVADAGPDQSVQVGDLVTLDGSGSTDPDGHLPLIYGWAQTGGPSVALSDATAVLPTFTAPGTPTVLTFTLTVTDAHDLADPTPDEVVITVEAAPCTALDDVTIAGPPTTTVGIPATFTATVSPLTATLPVTYTWEATGQAPQVHTGGGLSDAAVFTWPVTDPQVVTVTAVNECGVVSATHVVTIKAAPPECPCPLTDVSIIGPTTGYTGTLYAFTSVITPSDATTPITYTWLPTPTSGQGTASAAYQWTAPDVYTITLTAENCGGLVSDTHAIAIEAGKRYIYLPLVMRNYAP